MTYGGKVGKSVASRGKTRTGGGRKTSAFQRGEENMLAIAGKERSGLGDMFKREMDKRRSGERERVRDNERERERRGE